MTAREAAARALCCLRFHGEILSPCHDCVAWKDHIHEANAAIDAYLAEATKGDHLLENLRAVLKLKSSAFEVEAFRLPRDTVREIADRIAALTARVEELEGACTFKDKTNKGLQDAYTGQGRAEAERDRLKARVEELEDRLKHPPIAFASASAPS